jgi:RNA polymerase sigma factor (sigma-70 family)
MGTPPFQVFLDAHRDHVYRFLVAAVGSQEADDCFQETFLAALRAYPRVRGESNLRAWVLTIAHNKAIDAFRAGQRRPDPVANPPEPRVDHPPEEDAAVWGSVRALPAKQRAAIVLRFANDLPHAEIGHVIGCSEDAARRNVHEGLEKLRGAWNR